MFKINFEYLITILLPTRLRKSKMIAWLRVLLSNIQSVYVDYIAYRELQLYDANFTGQVMYLEKKLQDTFNCPGIYIRDGAITLPVYLSNTDEGNLPQYFGNLFVLGESYNPYDEIIYNNTWYSYTTAGNGVTPDTDPSAVQGLPVDTFMFNIEEQLLGGSFIVYVPIACFNLMTSDDINKMRSIVQFYILADKTYEIKTF